MTETKLYGTTNLETFSSAQRPMELETLEQEPKIALVRIFGHLDGSNSGDLIKLGREVLDAEIKSLVVDCLETTLISSSGFASIAVLIKEFDAAGGRVGVINKREHLRQTFEVIGLSRYITMKSTRSDLLEAWAEPSNA